MKKYSLALALSLAGMASVAQNKLDWYAIDALEKFHGTVTEEGVVAPAFAKANKMVDVFVTVTSPAHFASLEAMGYDVNIVTDEIAIVNMPMADMEPLCQEPWVVHVALGGEARPMLDKARNDAKVDAIHAGTDAELGRAYTGKGVVVGVYDTGLDPNHINFLDQDMETRVQGLWANGAIYEGAQIYSFTTENSAQTHGTHVLGIAAGGYTGEANYAGTVAPTTGNMPYYGVAMDADIVIGCGSLSDANILKGVQYVALRAKELGEPAVINLSLGSNRGPHDGSDSFGRSLDALAKENLIVVSAGNEGRQNMGLTKLLTEEDPYLRTFPAPCNSANQLITASSFKGLWEIYASDERPFKCTIAVYADEGLTGRIVDSYTVEASTSGRSTKIGGTGAGTTGVKLNGFDAATSAASYVQIASNVITSTKRYSVQITHNLAITQLANDYYIAIIIEGQPGQRINMYAHSDTSSSNGIYGTFTDRYIDGYEAASPDGTINNMACAPNLLAIGAYVTRTNWRTYPTGSASYSGTLNKIAEFSSWGTMYDGSTLPHVLAPGSSLTSSVSGYNTTYASKTTGVTGFLQGEDRNYHWDNMSGTSMSAPFATGVFGLWLEADPNLTSADVKEVLKATSKVDVHLKSINPAQYGAGKLDALAGLKEVIRRRDAGVGNIIADNTSASLIVENLGDGNYNVFLPGGDKVVASLYNLAGAQVLSATSAGDALVLDASSLAPGIYVLKALNGNAAASTKLVVR